MSIKLDTEKYSINNDLINQYCSPNWIRKLNEGKTTWRFRKGELVINEGAYVNGVYFIHKGKAKVYKSLNGESIQVVKLSKDGDILGHRGVGYESYYPISVTALEESIISFVEIDLFIEVLRNSPDLTLNFMRFFAEELRKAEIRYKDSVTMTVREKVAEALLLIIDAYGFSANNTLNISLSRQEIADIAGTTKEQVSKFLSEFKETRIIDLKGKDIELKDIGRLRSHIFYSSF